MLPLTNFQSDILICLMYSLFFIKALSTDYVWLFIELAAQLVALDSRWKLEFQIWANKSPNFMISYLKNSKQFNAQ